ncbi:hypothetical protein KKE06_02085 [Candidatus Micrarchaeota archaeon]|nr:hypothetical protein [Candidatus Micrarchaeota archaeon]MBU1929980.1 hypothetical protein [Candidatus Micrarchaeota archaeon]
MLPNFGLTIILSAVEFFSERISRYIERYHIKIVSLNAGIMLSFLFLLVFPELFEKATGVDNTIFFFLFLGFIAFHLTEKFVYRHTKDQKELKKELGLLHLGGFYITGMVEGMALLFSARFIGITASSLIFVPLLLNSINASVYMVHLSEKLWKNRVLDLVLATGPIIGYLLAFGLSGHTSFTYSIFAFVSGALLYTVVRDTLPAGKKGEPVLFVIGVLITMLTLQLAGFLF